LYSPAGAAPGRAVLTLPELDARLRTFMIEEYFGQHGVTN
jgi:hypothetical protein